MHLRALPAILLPAVILAAGAAGQLPPAGGTRTAPRPWTPPPAPSTRAPRPPAAAPPAAAPAAAFVEGRDFVVLRRVRFLDRMGFDRPVEAFSILFPAGWKTEGGVRWGNWQGCRGDMVSSYVKASSPDGAVRLEVYPSRSFSWAGDPQMLQLLQAGAQQGGCAINQPFDARRYIEGFARRDLGAQASGISEDQARLAQMRQLDQMANETARQYGNDTQQSTTMATAQLTWPDGSGGILQVGVMNSVLRKPDPFSGGVSVTTTTSVFHCVLIRFPAGRQEEGAKALQLALTSHRMNPVWSEAKNRFITELSRQEHVRNMERIRLMGEQSRAYARAQSDSSDRRMRDWENRQDSQDRQHRSFIQTIREVETWRDGSGRGVELTAGYEQAWSRGDGSYILTNKPGFDPRSVLQEQEWQPLERER